MPSAGRTTRFNLCDFNSQDVAASAAGAAVSITYAAADDGAGTGKSHAISGIAWSYSAAPATGSLKVDVGTTSGTATVFHIDITAAGPGSVIFPVPRLAPQNEDMVITLGAGGGAVIGRLSVLGHWIDQGGTYE